MGSSTQAPQEQTRTSSSSSGSSQAPYQQGYYDQSLQQANNLYQNYGMPQYYGGATVAGMTPAQMESMNQTSNWTTGGAQDMMANQNQQYQQMMSGRVNTGEGSPYGDMANVFREQATDQANQLMGNVRGSQVMSGQQGGSSRGDLLNNQVIENANDQVSNNLAGMYNNAYNQAQNTQNNALGQYGSMMNMPLQMSQALYNQVGLPQQQYNQNVMNDAKARYDYNAMNPYRNLEMFNKNIAGNMGGSTSSSSSGTTVGPAPQQQGGGSFLNNVGKIAGIGAQLMGIPGGGLISGLFSGGGGGNYKPVPSTPSQPYWT